MRVGVFHRELAQAARAVVGQGGTALQQHAGGLRVGQQLQARQVAAEHGGAVHHAHRGVQARRPSAQPVQRGAQSVQAFPSNARRLVLGLARHHQRQRNAFAAAAQQQLKQRPAAGPGQRAQHLLAGAAELLRHHGMGVSKVQRIRNVGHGKSGARSSVWLG